jgi:putative glutamine amidotransferase
MRPLIGITMSFEQTDAPQPKQRSYLNAAYTDAIFAAGGTPFPLAPPVDADESLIDDMLRRVDGLLFTGGPDLDPKHYGQRKHAKTELLHARRDAWDIELFRRADRSRQPILSICLGCQIANVARGGCLVQHIDDVPRPATVEHYKPDHSAAYHAVRVEAGSRLERIVGTRELEVNSRHHQTIDSRQVGGRLKPVAFAPDGVVEAAEDTDGRFLLAVQWHPEDMIDRREHLALFEALVEAARR